MPKLPSSKASRHGGNGPTAFHQDFITFAVDRSGGMTFWFPLEAVRPRGGDDVVRERLAPRRACSATTRPTATATPSTAFPELQDLEMSEPMHLRARRHHGPHPPHHPRRRREPDGPAAVGVLLVTQPEDVCWNGSPCPNFDHTRDEAVGALRRRAVPGDQLMAMTSLPFPNRELHAGVLGRARSRGRHRRAGSGVAGVGPFFWFDGVAVHRRPPPRRARRLPGVHGRHRLRRRPADRARLPGERRARACSATCSPAASTACTTWRCSATTTRPSATPTSPPAPSSPSRARSATQPHLLGRHVAHARVHGRAARAEPVTGRGVRRHARRPPRRGTARTRSPGF